MHQKTVRPRGGTADWPSRGKLLPLGRVKKRLLFTEKRERAYKQIEEKLRTERAVIQAKITTIRQQCWQLLRSFACATQQVPTTPNIVGPNNVVACCVRLHGPLCCCLSFAAWPLLPVGPLLPVLYWLSSVACLCCLASCCQLSLIFCRCFSVAYPSMSILSCLSSVACRMLPALSCLSLIIVNQRCSVVSYMLSLVSPLLNDFE